MTKSNAALKSDNKKLKSDLKESKDEVKGIKADLESLQLMVESITGAPEVEPASQASPTPGEPDAAAVLDAAANYAINNPVIIHKRLDTDGEQIGLKENTLRFEFDDDGESKLIGTGIYDMDSPNFNEKMANLYFMEEMVEVVVPASPEQFADQRFEICVNGQKQFFLRGLPVTVQRKFVEGLARAKPVRVTNKEVTDESGVKSVEYPQTSGLRYPFQVLNDANPIGSNWLKSVLAQG